MLNDSFSQLGFKSFSAVSSPTFCGTGALQIQVDISNEQDAGPVGHGELYLSLGSVVDLSGKVLTVHMMAVPASAAIRFSVIPVNTLTYGPTAISISPVTADWTTRSATFDNSPDSGVTMVERLSIQVNNATSTTTPQRYVGTIYIDEIDISTPVPDGGTGDGGALDTRADAVGDVRDAPPAN